MISNFGTLYFLSQYLLIYKIKKFIILIIIKYFVFNTNQTTFVII